MSFRGQPESRIFWRNPADNFAKISWLAGQAIRLRLDLNCGNQGRLPLGVVPVGLPGPGRRSAWRVPPMTSPARGNPGPETRRTLPLRRRPRHPPAPRRAPQRQTGVETPLTIPFVSARRGRAAPFERREPQSLAGRASGYFPRPGASCHQASDFPVSAASKARNHRLAVVGRRSAISGSTAAGSRSGAAEPASSTAV